MKKLLSLLALVGALGVAGCSCSKEGVYKFESLEITVGDETKTYTCTDEEKEDFTVAMVCEGVTRVQYELKDDKIIYTGLDEDGNPVEGQSEETEYKIEDGKLMVKEDDSEEFMELGTYEKGKLIFEDEGMKIVFKKD